MKNSEDLGGCYPPRPSWITPSASVDNTLLDLQNSSYPTQPHSILLNIIIQSRYFRKVSYYQIDTKIALIYHLHEMFLLQLKINSIDFVDFALKTAA